MVTECLGEGCKSGNENFGNRVYVWTSAEWGDSDVLQARGMSMTSPCTMLCSPKLYQSRPLGPGDHPVTVQMAQEGKLLGLALLEFDQSHRAQCAEASEML